ncbi:hypothetical protein [Mycobacterium sp. URHB0044]|uniref:hypothetical protein n=1 Tax=Mycobacterium sp. URHB0044 TaxID=1380386 RepID=UPI00048F79A3|nr:hypothetical protein [Mycobacterium sp. URHB0044]
MTAGSTSPAAPLRGLAAGALTVALSIPAHAAAGGGTPSGATSAQLVLLAMVVGGLAATIGGGDRFRVQFALMAGGQLLGHLLLGTVGHHHATGASPSAVVMVAAHVVAVTCGAALIAAAGYLCTVVSRVVRAADAPAPAPLIAVPAAAFGFADQPLRSALLLAASMSHRGPPVSAVR